VTYRRIGLDMDGCLYNWDAAIRALIVERFGIEVPVSTTWDFIKEYAGAEAWRWVWKPKQVVRMFSEGRAYPGAAEGAAALRAMTDQLFVISSGPSESTDPKTAWLEKQGIEYDRLIRLDFGVPKTAIPCDLYVDDGPHVAEQVVRAKFKQWEPRLILVDRPWNQDVEDHPRMHRARGWEEVVRVARDLQKRAA
jgi:uncharacterized HAD superfamily protein